MTAGLALSIAAIGCGDDDTSSSGGAGSGGSAGKSGSVVDTPTCVSTTTALFQGQPSSASLSSECIACTCKENPKAILDCDGNADCWLLLDCANKNCSNVPQAELTSCALKRCGSWAPAATTAMPAGLVIQGDACSAKCIGGGEPDAGAADAGL